MSNAILSIVVGLPVVALVVIFLVGGVVSAYGVLEGFGRKGCAMLVVAVVAVLGLSYVVGGWLL